MARDCPRGKPAAQPFSGGVMGLGEAGGKARTREKGKDRKANKDYPR